MQLKWTKSQAPSTVQIARSEIVLTLVRDGRNLPHFVIWHEGQPVRRLAMVMSNVFASGEPTTITVQPVAP